MSAGGRESGDLIADFEQTRPGLLRKRWVASELQCGDSARSIIEDRSDNYAAVRNREVAIGVAIVDRLVTPQFVDEHPKMGCEREHSASARPLEITAAVGKSESVESRAELRVTAPVAAEHQRMIFGEIVIDAYQRRGVVVESLLGSQWRRERKPVRLHDIQKASDGIRIRAESLQREGIRSEQGQERIRSPRETERAKRE